MHSAILVLIGAQALAPAAPCGCAQFAGADPYAGNEAAIVSDSGRAIRDFALYAHRRIAEDLIRQRGLYLDTLIDAFPYCQQRATKLAWFRQLLASTSDTRIFAERIAQQHESSRSCPSGAP